MICNSVMTIQTYTLYTCTNTDYDYHNNRVYYKLPEYKVYTYQIYLTLHVLSTDLCIVSGRIRKVNMTAN